MPWFSSLLLWNFYNYDQVCVFNSANVKLSLHQICVSTLHQTFSCFTIWEIQCNDQLHLHSFLLMSAGPACLINHPQSKSTFSSWGRRTFLLSLSGNFKQTFFSSTPSLNFLQNFLTSSFNSFFASSSLQKITYSRFLIFQIKKVTKNSLKEKKKFYTVYRNPLKKFPFKEIHCNFIFDGDGSMFSPFLSFLPSACYPDHFPFLNGLDSGLREKGCLPNHQWWHAKWKLRRNM